MTKINFEENSGALVRLYNLIRKITFQNNTCMFKTGNKISSVRGDILKGMVFLDIIHLKV